MDTITSTPTAGTPAGKTSPWQKLPVIFISALACCALWGSAYPCIKIGYALFEIPADSPASQLLFAGLRFFLAGILTLIMGGFISRKLLLPKKSSWKGISLLALTQTVVQYLFFYLGLAHTSGVKSSLVGALTTFFAIFISALIFRMEKLTPRKLLGCVLGFAGIIIINLSGVAGMTFDFHLNGEGFILLSNLSYAFSSNFARIFSQKDDPVMLSGCQFVLGGLVLILVGVLTGGHLAMTGIAGVGLILYMAFISAAAYSLWGILLKYNSVSTVTVFGFMTPVFGVLLSALLLGERGEAFSLKSLVALALVCLGILIVNTTIGTRKRQNH
ncbi:MAG: DMT family transporter [Lachnospiraceae bacterium]|nr:DMT family transporter [Lachnospiraceae bacterium]